MTESIEKLKFRRQFIFSSKHLQVEDSWKSDTFIFQSSEWHLSYHPDLEITTGSKGDVYLILLGYALDPYSPQLTNKEIVNDLLSKGSFKELLAYSGKYTGRYVIIYKDNSSLFILNDAVGFREIYYTFNNGTFACGSTPNIVSKYMGLQKTRDPYKLSYFNSKLFKDHANTWIGYGTLFDDISHLAPNHYLDILKKKIIRFWPLTRLEKIDPETCAKECSKILEGTIAAATGRYKIHLGLTAGWDTRLLLAACRNYMDKIFFYVNKLPGYKNNHKDIRIPEKLSEKLDFKLNIINIEDKIDPDFEKCFYENNVLAYETHLPVFYNVYRNNWEDTYTMSGTMGNAMARIYIDFPDSLPMTGENLSIAAGLNKSKYVVNELNRWSLEVSELCRDKGIRIMDLYQWEQENPNWAALTSSEQDIAREEIRPINNRRLIELFWSLDDKYRYQYYPEIYIKIMHNLWKDVLPFPFNPSKKDTLYKVLRFAGIERKFYNVYKFSRFCFRKKFSKSSF